ncbi:MAG TPA: metal ABC transporter substrate-binding protein [Candidatus Eremiobacteraceae bacterium]|nr:metal ABC transporter substrate-binding protein [Candidatus Eremiobacteraceae bacterium]
MILDKMMKLGLTGLAIAALAGCAQKTDRIASGTSAGRPASAKLDVVATFSTLGAIVADVGGDRVAVTSLVPIGAAPETYEPAPSDIVTLEHADLVFENGAGLETWMDHLLRSVNAPQKLVVLAPQAVTGADGRINPHYWLDPTYAASYAAKIAAALEQIDPAGAAVYRRNLAATRAKYAALDRWIRLRVATVPPQRRAMICFHDAWYHFDARYGIRDVGAVEPVPGEEPSAGAFAQLIADARRYQVHAVFAEPQFSPKLAQQLASGAGISAVTDLYDDTLGGTPALSTYVGLMHYDVNRIVEALQS